MADLPLHTPIVGIDNVSDDFSLAPGTVRDATNVIIDRVGGVERRDGRALALSGAFHSMWTDGSGRTYGVRAGVICRFELSGTAISYTPIETAPAVSLPAPGPVRFDEHNGVVVACSRDGLFSIGSDGTAEALSLPRPPAPSCVAGSSGGLHAGRYGVAVSWLRRSEEGPLSPSWFVDVGEGGGITASLPLDDPSGADGIRIYRTGPNGDVLMRAQDAPTSMSQYTIGAQDMGRAATNQHLEPMPGGEIVRHWRGRLLVASGRVLMATQPMRYGLTDPRTDWVQFPARIDIMVALEGGVFVGTSDGVVFLDGATPNEWKQVRKSARRVLRGSDLRVRADLLGGEEPGDRWVAVWLAENGFVVGTPDGRLIEQQAKRIRLPDSETAAGVAAAVVHDRQIIASIN